MKTAKVLFVGGNPLLGSVQIRCVDIARHTGHSYVTGIERIEQIPRGYGIYILVKIPIDPSIVRSAFNGAVIIWDIIDCAPPVGAGAYIASTLAARNRFSQMGHIYLIRHHHCNSTNRSNSPGSSTVGWIGHSHWQPANIPTHVRVFHTNHCNVDMVADMYRRLHICLNTRSETPDSKTHAGLSSGIKLINCIGFGIPSISSLEEPYLEINDGCTIFCECSDEVPELLAYLRRNPGLLSTLRARCSQAAEKFSIRSIASNYRSLLAKI